MPEEYLNSLSGGPVVTPSLPAPSSTEVTQSFAFPNRKNEFTSNDMRLMFYENIRRQYTHPFNAGSIHPMYPYNMYLPGGIPPQPHLNQSNRIGERSSWLEQRVSEGGSKPNGVRTTLAEEAFPNQERGSPTVPSSRNPYEVPSLIPNVLSELPLQASESNGDERELRSPLKPEISQLPEPSCNDLMERITDHINNTTQVKQETPEILQDESSKNDLQTISPTAVKAETNQDENQESSTPNIQIRRASDLCSPKLDMQNDSREDTRNLSCLDMNDRTGNSESSRDGSDFDEEMRDVQESGPSNLTFSNLTCPLCFKQVPMSDFTKHLEAHKKMHSCPICHFSTDSEIQLAEHRCVFQQAPEGSPPPATDNKKGKSRKNICKICKLECPDKVEYYSHLRTHISADKLLACTECPFVTQYKHHFEYHIKNHKGKKDFKCNICEYQCVNKSMLNSHMKSHSNFYSFRCDDCNYEAKYMHALKMHCRKHNHKPHPVLNPDGTINPFPIVDVWGTRRGPKIKRDAQGNPIYPTQYIAKFSMHTTNADAPAIPSTSSPISSVNSLPSTSSVTSTPSFNPHRNPPVTPNFSAFPGLIANRSFFKSPQPSPLAPQFSYLNSPHSPLTANPNNIFSNLSNSLPLSTNTDEPRVRTFENRVTCRICSVELLNEQALKIHTLLLHMPKQTQLPENWDTPPRAPPVSRKPEEINQIQLIEKLFAAQINSQQSLPIHSSPPLSSLFPPYPYTVDQLHTSRPEAQPEPAANSTGPLDLTKDHTPPQQIIRRRLSESPGEVSPSSLTPPDTCSPKKVFRPSTSLANRRLNSTDEDVDVSKDQESTPETPHSDDSQKLSNETQSSEANNFVMDCDMCNITFRSETMFSTHMRFHDESNPLRCAFCHQTLPDTNSFFEHCYSCKSR